MLKALLRKQMLEIRGMYLAGRRKKDGAQKKARNPKGMLILFAVLYVIIMLSMFAMSFGVGSALIPAGLDWMYFTILNIIAFLLGVIGSAFSTAQALFRSKDNEMLLAMPIPPAKIIFVRIISVYLISFIYESVVIIPGIVYYFIAGHPNFLSVVFCILSLFLMAFLITAVSCGAGWVVAWISTKFKNQKILLTLFVILLIGVLYYFQFNASRLINSIIMNAEEIAGAIQGWGYPLYAPGLGMTGNGIGFLVFLLMTAVLFGLAYLLVTKSFSRFALSKTEGKKAIFQKSAIQTSQVGKTLLRRELRRFLASMSYMLNAGLGMLFLLAGGVIVLIKMDSLREFLQLLNGHFADSGRLVTVFAACLIGILTSFCLMAACSISLEGKKYIWIYQSMPLDPYRIFLAKIELHVLLTGIPALFAAIAVGIAIQASAAEFVAMLLFTLCYVMFCASFQLMLDLKRPKLSWTNENQALKTNLTVLVDMLVGFLIPVALGAIYLLLFWIISPAVYLLIWAILFAGGAVLLQLWLRGRGREIFSTL